MASEFGARLPDDFAEAVADDAEMLAQLNDRELTQEVIDALQACRFPYNLGILPDGGHSDEAWRLMAAAVDDLPRRLETAQSDALAADFAAIYLTGAYGASPCESPWTDDDRLTCQRSMFELRDIYAAAGLSTVDWRQRPDDHLVLQLLYIAHAARTATQREDWAALARLLDEHLLRWLPDFAHRIASRCEQTFYAGLALLTEQWCERLRDVLSAYLGQARPTAEEIAARLNRLACQRRPKSDPLRGLNAEVKLTHRKYLFSCMD